MKNQETKKADIVMTHRQGRFRWYISGQTEAGRQAVDKYFPTLYGLPSVVDDYADQVPAIVAPLTVEMRLS